MTANAVPAVATVPATDSATVTAGAAAELLASGRLLAKLAVAMMNVQRDRIRPKRPRPLHRV
jgi:hypothetical protein